MRHLGDTCILSTYLPIGRYRTSRDHVKRGSVGGVVNALVCEPISFGQFQYSGASGRKDAGGCALSQVQLCCLETWKDYRTTLLELGKRPQSSLPTDSPSTTPRSRPIEPHHRHGSPHHRLASSGTRSLEIGRLCECRPHAFHLRTAPGCRLLLQSLQGRLQNHQDPRLQPLPQQGRLQHEPALLLLHGRNNGCHHCRRRQVHCPRCVTTMRRESHRSLSSATSDHQVPAAPAIAKCAISHVH